MLAHDQVLQDFQTIFLDFFGGLEILKTLKKYVPNF